MGASILSPKRSPNIVSSFAEADLMGDVHVHCPTLEIVGKPIESFESPGLETLSAILTPVRFRLALDDSTSDPADCEPKIIDQFLLNEWTRLEDRCAAAFGAFSRSQADSL